MRPQALALLLVWAPGVAAWAQAAPAPQTETHELRAGGAALAWRPQLHQNGGGTCSGHQLCWGDQNLDVIADHAAIQSQDASQIVYLDFSGPLTAGDRIGINISLRDREYPEYVAVQPGDDHAALARRLAAMLNGGLVAVDLIVAGGSGYKIGDVIYLSGAGMVCPGIPAAAVVSTGRDGAVTAAAPAVSTGVFGGYCTTAPVGSLTQSFTTGDGRGAILSGRFGDAGYAAALAGYTVPSPFGGSNFGYQPTANVEHGNPRNGNWTTSFDLPWGAGVGLCDQAQRRGCPGPAPSEILNLNMPGILDNGPYFMGARAVWGREPVAGDQLTCYYMGGQSSARSWLDTQYGQICAEVEKPDPANPAGRVFIAAAGPSTAKLALPIIYFSPDLGAYMFGQKGNGAGTFTAARLFASDVTIAGGSALHMTAGQITGDAEGAAPTLSGCGSGSSVAGNDSRGTVTVGAGAVEACTIRFASAWADVPAACVATAEAKPVSIAIRAKSRTALTLAFSANLGGARFEYICLQ